MREHTLRRNEDRKDDSITNLPMKTPSVSMVLCSAIVKEKGRVSYVYSRKIFETLLRRASSCLVRNPYRRIRS